MRYTVIRDLYNIYIFGGAILAMLGNCKKILDLGCGRDSLLVRSGIVKRAEVYGLDIFKPYVDGHNTDGTYRYCICADAVGVDFNENEFDAVVCMEVLEHIDKDRIIESGLLQRMQKWARKVIITTPNGYVGNDVSDGNVYQEHLSSWNIEDFIGHGYKVRGLSGWKSLRTDGATLRYNTPFLFWAGLSLLTVVGTYYLPRQSYHLLATYEKKNIRT